jgi:tRNA wybutosine-synthesizing protein 4
VERHPECNIISLGAGFDSTFFWLKAAKISDKVCYIEVDYPDVVRKKIQVIRANSILAELVMQGGLNSDSEIETGDYKLFEADVRDIPLIE